MVDFQNGWLPHFPNLRQKPGNLKQRPCRLFPPLLLVGPLLMEACAPGLSFIKLTKPKLGEEAAPETKSPSPREETFYTLVLPILGQLLWPPQGISQPFVIKAPSKAPMSLQARGACPRRCVGCEGRVAELQKRRQWAI